LLTLLGPRFIYSRWTT